MKTLVGKAQKKFVIAAAALCAMSLASGLGVVSLAGNALENAREAELVSAVGNTIEVQNATYFPWSYHTTEAACRTEGRAVMARNPGRFYGYQCTKVTSGTQIGKWKLSMGEYVCGDRVIQADGIGASLRREIL